MKYANLIQNGNVFSIVGRLPGSGRTTKALLFASKQLSERRTVFFISADSELASIKGDVSRMKEQTSFQSNLTYVTDGQPLMFPHHPWVYLFHSDDMYTNSKWLNSLLQELIPLTSSNSTIVFDGFWGRFDSIVESLSGLSEGTLPNFVITAPNKECVDKFVQGVKKKSVFKKE